MKNIGISDLQIKMLVTSVIFEIKYNTPLARNAIGIKNLYKQAVGLPKNASNKQVLRTLGMTFQSNNLMDAFNKLMTTYEMSTFIIKP